jgi:hypothetical protein
MRGLTLADPALVARAAGSGVLPSINTITNAGANGTGSSSATLTLTPSVNFAAGDLAVLVLAADNAGTNGASSVTGVSDTSSNTWTSQIDATADPGAASEGATLRVWTALVGGGGLDTGDTITVSFSPNTTAKAAHLYRVQGTGTLTVAATGSSTGTMPVAETTGTLAVGDAVFGVLAIENRNGTITYDSDTLNGNWSTAVDTLGDGGTAGSSMRAVSQWKIVTGTGAQTWNVALASQDRASGTVVVRAT